jgi:hypothetical protein
MSAGLPNFQLSAKLFSKLFNIEQTQRNPLLYDRAVSGMNMEQQPQWRFEVNNPLRSADWDPLWEVDEEQLVQSQELRDELNRINAPVQLRIVRCAHQALLDSATNRVIRS